MLTALAGIEKRLKIPLKGVDLSVGDAVDRCFDRHITLRDVTFHLSESRLFSVGAEGRETDLVQADFKRRPITVLRSPKSFFAPSAVPDQCWYPHH